jgi:hypothetical protein
LLLLLALVSDLIVDYDSFLHTRDGEITFYRNSLFNGIHFTFNRPSTAIQGAEVHIVPSPVTFAIPLFIGGHLSSSSRLRNRLALISHMQVSYGHGRTIIS